MTELGDRIGTDIGRPVHDDCALEGAVVHARLEPVQAQRVTVATDVGVRGAKQTEARPATAQAIGEVPRQVVAGGFSVRHPFLEQQSTAPEVEHPQPWLGRWPRVVDHREARSRPAAGARGALRGLDRQIDDGATGARRLCRELAGRGQGVCRAGEEEQHRREP